MTTTMMLELTARQNRNVLARTIDGIRERMTKRNHRRMFLAMDDHMLRDIGMTRGDALAGKF
jgi:uncharacterized protein YjiS (DUF1127 family)